MKNANRNIEEEILEKHKAKEKTKKYDKQRKDKSRWE